MLVLFQAILEAILLTSLELNASQSVSKQAKSVTDLISFL